MNPSDFAKTKKEIKDKHICSCDLTKAIEKADERWQLIDAKMEAKMLVISRDLEADFMPFMQFIQSLCSCALEHRARELGAKLPIRPEQHYSSICD